MLFALDICVIKKAPPTHSVHWSLNPHPRSYLKNITPSFFFSFSPSPLLNVQTIQAALFRRFTPPPPPPKKLFFHALPPPPIPPL